jgi:REP element-mobilizing transposase RayT
MPFIKVYIHFVWVTKNRTPFLDSPDLRKKVWMHILENARSKDIFIDTINGYQDHCHCLISLGTEQSMSTVMQMIKGESAYWINKYRLCKQKFQWQPEYYAASVSDSALDKVRTYIRNQETHHGKATFKQEYDLLLEIIPMESSSDSGISEDQIRLKPE